MQHSLFGTSRNVVAPAEKRNDNRNQHAGRDDSAAEKIREARGILADVLLRDDLAFKNTALLGAVADDLNRIVLELEQSAGLQQLFELWITHGE